MPDQVAGSPNLQDYTDQQVFIKRCRNKEEFNVRITWPDGEINSYLFQSLGYEVDDGSQEDWKLFTVNGSQNTRTLWAIEATPASASIAAAATTQLTVETVPLDLDRGADVVTYSSAAEETATVDEAGLVTGVAAGTVNITSTFRGVSAVTEITVTS